MIDPDDPDARAFDESAVRADEALLCHEAWETWVRDEYKQGLEERFQVTLAYAPDDRPSTQQRDRIC